MRPGGNGAPIVSGCQHDGIDAVHDAFVVGDGAIRIDVSKLIGFDQPVAHFITGELSFGQKCSRYPAFGGRQAVGRVIGQDAHQSFAAGQTLQVRDDAFHHRIDDVGPHRLQRLDMEMDDKKRRNPFNIIGGQTS